MNKVTMSMTAALLLLSSVSCNRFLLHLPEPTVLANVTHYDMVIAKTFDEYNVYTTQMKLGSDMQRVSLVLATNTEQTMITSVNCTKHELGGCDSGVYNATKSNSEHIGQIPIYQELEIGNNWRLSGVNMTEVLYFSNGVSQVDKNMPLYLITDVNAKDFKTFPFEGVLGLSPNVPDNNYTSLGKAIPLHLKDMQMVDNAFVGINMFKDTQKQSLLTIGRFDQSQFRNTSENLTSVPWFTVNATKAKNAWNHPISNFYYGGYSLDDNAPNMGIFDSFWPGIHLPLAEWGYLKTNWSSNAKMSGYLQCNDTERKCGFLGECRQYVEDFFYLAFNFVDDRAYQVSPADYLLDTKTKTGQNWCEVGVYGSNTSAFILGDVFMQSLYVMLDYENSRFALNGKWVPTSQMDTQNYNHHDDAPAGKATVWIIIGAVVGVLIAVAVIGFVIVRRKNRRLEDNLSKYETL